MEEADVGAGRGTCQRASEDSGRPREAAADGARRGGCRWRRRPSVQADSGRRGGTEVTVGMRGGGVQEAGKRGGEAGMPGRKNLG
ncbi:hypothetical protein GUJ93_ZPchr0003g17566 [Zizania palustris]|uniref:Uncharacterized protein n=1 Tax=Zizania palustris TaxID=103762 RepID=A0A8J5VII5_ZIZPA|nr:hypothetical protein GUJ93_ZPchr0003g17566 [Zizania palustris]